jgi:hypothetical protein
VSATAVGQRQRVSGEPQLAGQTVIVIGGSSGPRAWCEHRAFDVAVFLMVNTAVTGATYDVDGGQQLVGA